MVYLLGSIRISMEKATRFWLKTFLLLVCVVVVSQSLLPPSEFSTYNQARCQAFCFTQFSGSNNPATCDNLECESCLVPCKGILQTVQDCNRNCANDACKSSCQFIASNLGNESSYTTKIAPPGVPTVLGTNFTSVSLSWEQPSNVTIGTIVYAVEMKYEGDLSGDWKTLDIITSSHFAVVTDFSLCITIPRFYETYFRPSYDGIYYQFRIVALTANTSASRSLATGKIRLQIPVPVENVTFNILHYDDSRGDKLYFLGKWTSSSDGADKYYVNWQAPNNQCFNSFGRSPSRTRTENAPNITFNVQHDQRNGCPNTFKVYVLKGCSFSRPAAVTVINHGCRNILNYPPAECCKVHPPELENPDDLLVRNLKRGPLSVSQDFKFSFNITWDPPVYFEQSGCQVLQKSYSIRYGDPTKFKPCFGPFCRFLPKQWGNTASVAVSEKYWELNEINQGDQFKFTIETTLSKHVGDQRKAQINFTISDELKVQRLAVTFVITPGSVRSRVSWRKPSFDGGFLKHYLISYKDENDADITRTTNITNFITDNTQLRQTLPVQVTPVYSDSGFVGISSEINASPNANKIWNLQSKWENRPEGPVLRISWDKPAIERNILHYVVNYTIQKPGAPEQRSSNTSSLNYTIIGIKYGRATSITFKIKPVFAAALVEGSFSDEKSTSVPKPYESTLKVQNIMSKIEEGLNVTFKVNLSWEEPSFKFEKLLYYQVHVNTSGSPGAVNRNLTFPRFENIFIIIEKLASKEKVYLQVTPTFDSPFINGVASSFTVNTPADCAIRKPCKNGATCVDKYSGYECSCKPGFSGKDCENDIDECAVRRISNSNRGEEASLCLNGGLCHDKVNDYECECQEGFGGKRCETNIDDCAVQPGEEAAPCLNGGLCRDKVNGYECECEAGFSGKRCETSSTETRVRNLKGERKNGALHISWEKPTKQVKVLYYVVNYEIQKPGAAEKHSVNTTELRVTVSERKEGEGQWEIVFKVRPVFSDPSVKGFFSEDKKAPSTLARNDPSDKKFSKAEVIGLTVGLVALVIVILILTVVICKCKNRRHSYKCESFKLDQQ